MDLPGFRKELFQAEEPLVIRGHLGKDLNAVAGGEDDSFGHGFHLEKATVGLGDVLLGEREPLQQLDWGPPV